MNRLLSVIFLLSALGAVNAQTYEGRVIAINQSFVFHNPHEPKQVFVIETQSKGSTAKKIFRVIYNVPTNGRRGGAKEIDEKGLVYTRHLVLKLRKPDDDEKDWCRRIENYVRNDDGKGTYLDENNEPRMLFKSTQFDGWVIFKDLEKIPCLILDRFDD